jgi:hypothetical protein
MAERERPKKKRGPKGGIKHQPGSGHDRKSKPQKTKRLQKKAARQRAAELAEAHRQWAVWDSLTAEHKKVLHDLKPTLPRPDDG